MSSSSEARRVGWREGGREGGEGGREGGRDEGRIYYSIATSLDQLIRTCWTMKLEHSNL